MDRLVSLFNSNDITWYARQKDLASPEGTVFYHRQPKQGVCAVRAAHILTCCIYFTYIIKSAKCKSLYGNEINGAPNLKHNKFRLIGQIAK